MKKLLIPSALLAVVLLFPTALRAQDSDMFDILTNFINDEQNASLVKLQDDIAKGEKYVSQAEASDIQTLSFSTAPKRVNLKKVKRNRQRLNL